MNLWEVVDDNISKKWGLAMYSMYLLQQMNSPSWQIMAVACTAIIAQMWIDLKAKKDIPKISAQII